MAIKNLSPYVHLYGAASEAIPFYERVLGAKVEALLRFGDAKAMNHETPPEVANQVMHSVLRIGSVTLSISDGMPGAKKPDETNTFVLLELDDHADAAQRFEALAKGGAVRVPFSNAFWGGKFGVVTDVFGTSWMFQSDESA
jgi:PhnB protein